MRVINDGRVVIYACQLLVCATRDKLKLGRIG
jgi:hypothetical protein